jgi:hypothetical protein
MSQLSKIAQLNDAFRANLLKMSMRGQVLMTHGVSVLSAEDKASILRKVITFDDFDTERNDPYGEHDFGSFKQNSESIMWKIDYYDLDLKYGSPDPTDESKTKRILTIMKACEY